MSFLDKKEDVIDIKLTRFGKNLLARGFFKPVYYQFFDDGIIYDSNRVGIVETQNDSEDRINQAPILETQHISLSVERSFDVQKKLIEQNQRDRFVKIESNQDPLERDMLLKYPLYNYRGSTQEAPHFRLVSHGPEFNEVLTYLTSSFFDYKIPQITVNVNYNYILDHSVPNEKPDQLDTLSLLSEDIIFENGTKITLSKKDVIIELEEGSSLYGLENFEVEVYENKGDGSKDYIKIEDSEKISRLFNIEVDKDVKINNPNRKSNKGFYLR